MNKYVIPNLKKACSVLKLLAKEPKGLTMNEMGGRLDIPRTTLLRILSTLKDEEMVTARDRKYFLGLALIHLGSKALEKVSLRKVALPVLKELSQETRETAHLAVRAEDRALLIEVCDSPHPVRVASRSGTLADIHCSATGKVFLAYQVKDLAEFLDGKTLEARTPTTLTTIKELERDGELVRSRGYALDEEEYSEGVRCLAAPVRDAFGRVVAAIGITASVSTFTKKRIPSVAKQVMGAAHRISADLGDRG